MRYIKILLLLIFLTIGKLSLFSSDSVYYELWILDNLEKIGGHDVLVLGNPKIVKTDIGKAVEFDGNTDQLIVDFNPLITAKEFTVELIFNPDAYHKDNHEPRFVHIQDPNDPINKRVMMELRVTEKNECYLDGFVNTDTESLVLIDKTLVHPTGTWHHIAMTYKNDTLTTYFNGVKELCGTLKYTNEIISPKGKTSLGARMNNVSYYKGKMRAFKVTHAAIGPNELLTVHDVTDTSATNNTLMKSNLVVTLYQNPVANELAITIKGVNDMTTVNMKIFDMFGRELNSSFSELKYREKYSIDTSVLNTGIFLLQIHSGNYIERRKFHVKH